MRCLIIVDFPGPAPNRFILIYWKRDQDGTKRKFNKSPEISPPRVVHSGSKIGTVWNKTKLGNASEFPIIHIDIERVFLARWALFRPKVTGLWMWTIKENNWHYFRVRVHALGWIISRDWSILQASLRIYFSRYRFKVSVLKVRSYSHTYNRFSVKWSQISFYTLYIENSNLRHWSHNNKRYLFFYNKFLYILPLFLFCFL